MSDWVHVGSTKDLSPGESLAAECGREMVAVFNVDGQVYAVSNTCPHAAGPLVNGFVENGRVTCPWHGWSFELDPEKAANDGLCRYEVRVDGEDVYVRSKPIEPAKQSFD